MNRPDAPDPSAEGSAGADPEPPDTGSDPGSTSTVSTSVSMSTQAEPSGTGSSNGLSAAQAAAADRTRLEEASRRALGGYRIRMRRQRAVYYSVLAALVAAVVVIVVVAWQAGEVAHTHLTTVARPPANLMLTTPDDTQSRAWSTTDRAALGNPQWRGTVVTYDAHTVRGRNARTGAVTWSYTRTDRVVCDAVQSEGVTVAVYEVGGDCQEVTALNSATGVRRWTRTLDENGQPLQGHPTYSLDDSAGDATLAITSPGVVYDIGLSDGIDVWTYSHFGCSIERTVLGATDALISQTCSRPRCTDELKYCGRGPQLVLRSENSENGPSETNPNMILWNRLGDSALPVAATPFLAAVPRAHDSVEVLDDAKPTVLHQVALHAVPDGTAVPPAVPLADGLLVWVDGTTYRLSGDGDAVVWSTRTAGEPEVASDDQGQAQADDARITVPTAAGVAVLDGTNGRVTRRYSLAQAPPAGATVSSIGSGFLVSSNSGVTVYS